MARQRVCHRCVLHFILAKLSLPIVMVGFALATTSRFHDCLAIRLGFSPTGPFGLYSAPTEVREHPYFRTQTFTTNIVGQSSMVANGTTPSQSHQLTAPREEVSKLRRPGCGLPVFSDTKVAGSVASTLPTPGTSVLRDTNRHALMSHRT
jgi:hypothetical protein